ncbi:hypothetical protein IWW37_006000 [Coemansia sp. RSA 2050]|nr:hypothetical protein IWW37_006000 [Coemansia sp. RSA 2050]KAJ2728347.1 hypothetical protein IW152_006001 [Coemansia sp. BCRC 34962]
MSTHDGDKRTVAPQSIPGATYGKQQGRRSSFSAWPPTFFGGMSPPTRPQAFSSGIPPPVAHPFPTSGMAATTAAASGQLSDNNTPAAFSGIGLFRRFSASGASVDGSQPFGHAAAKQHYQSHPLPTSELADAIGRHARAELSGDALPQPKVLDEVRGKGDPPSRPDSRMRNLMLSGQFLI